MTLPLHISPADQSVEASERRLQLHLELASVNPNGWRKPHTGNGNTKRAHSKRTRIAALAKKAGHK